MSTPDPHLTGEPVSEEPVPSLPKEHPAETTNFIVALVAVAAALGFNLSTEAVIAGFVVLGTGPALITWVVNLYRDALRDLG